MSSGWDLRIFEIMRVKVKRESSSTCERARGGESVLYRVRATVRLRVRVSDWEGA